MLSGGHRLEKLPRSMQGVCSFDAGIFVFTRQVIAGGRPLRTPRPNQWNFFQFDLKLWSEPRQQEPLLLQPRSGRDFAYVTIIWSEDYVDNAIVWATGLIASGSTFRRLCMVARGKIERRKIRILSRPEQSCKFARCLVVLFCEAGAVVTSI